MIGKGDQPPSYDSMFGQLALQKAQSDGVVDYGKGAADIVNKKASGVCGAVVCGIFCSLLGIALPVTEIVIGSLYLKQCEAQYLLPIYLIVSGVFSCLSGSGGGAGRIMNRNKDEEEQEASTKSKAAGCCSGLMGLFTFIWFICGNVWVFGMEKCESVTATNLNTTSDCFTTDTAFSSSQIYCKKLLYDFVFYETIAKWAVVGSVLLCGCFCCFCICCVYCCKGKQIAERTNQASSAANAAADMRMGNV